MQNAKNFNNLENLLRSAKPADVELPSHRANLRRALMSKPDSALKNNLNKKFSPMKFTLDLSKIAFATVAIVAVVIGGVALYDYLIQKPSTQTANGTQVVWTNITDNMVVNTITDNYSFVAIKPNQPSEGSIDLKSMVEAIQDINIRDEVSYTKYYHQEMGIEIEVPTGFDRFSPNPNQYIFWFTDSYDNIAQGEDGRWVSIEATFGYMEGDDPSGYSANYSEMQTMTLGGIKVFGYEGETATGWKGNYIFLTPSGELAYLRIYYTREYYSKNSQIDTPAQAAEDKAIYAEITQKIRNSIKFTQTFNNYIDNEGGFGFDIPSMFSEAGRTITSMYTIAIFKFTGRNGYLNDSMLINIISDFDKYLESGYDDYIYETDETVTLGHLTATIYKHNENSTSLGGGQYYVFKSTNGRTYAIYVQSIKNQLDGPADVLELTNFEKARYDEILQDLLKSFSWYE